VALVAAPVLIILAAGAYVTTQAVEQLRQAQDAQKVATATLQSNRLSQALENEVLSTVTLYQNPAKSTALRLNAARAATDRATTRLPVCSPTSRGAAGTAARGCTSRTS